LRRERNRAIPPLSGLPGAPLALAKRYFELESEQHTLLMVKHLTPELDRQEIEVWKKVIRIINHELNNSLAPISSMVHSARLIAKNPEQLGKLGRLTVAH
jgi:hypothetical protein